MPLVTVEVADSIGTLTLDHPGRRNALSAAMIAALVEGLNQLVAESVRAVVLRARPGVKIWSAGHDIEELPTTPRDPLGWSQPLRTLALCLQSLPIPILALVEGGVWGAACEVVFGCDLILATPEASFAITPARLGVPYNVTGLKTLSLALPRSVLREMLFTARPLSAERAWHIGAINHLVPAERITDSTLELARIIAANAPLTLGAIKETLAILDESPGLTATQFERLRVLRRQVGTSADYREGLAAFSEKRAPQFRGK